MGRQTHARQGLYPAPRFAIGASSGGYGYQWLCFFDPKWGPLLTGRPIANRSFGRSSEPPIIRLCFFDRNPAPDIHVHSWPLNRLTNTAKRPVTSEALAEHVAPMKIVKTNPVPFPNSKSRLAFNLLAGFHLALRPSAKIRIPMEIEKIYEPRKFEPRWAQWWVETGLYNANPNSPGPPFSIVIPPPNVTGSLHMGHMLEHTIIDAAVRWHRMRGDNTLWVPGVDHAGIATQLLVERMLSQQGCTRQQLGREEFLKRVWEWKEKYGNRITEQMVQIGDSVDWSRAAFTLSPQLSRAVIEAFVTLYERGLIYRGAYMVNWCPRCHTAISDLETVHEDTEGSLWHIRYPVTGTDRFLTVATTRPETMLGDTAVAVNPQDSRYFDLHGHTVTLPLMNREIPIILDELADPAFGSGAVKVTPAHDPNDFEVGKRHNLPRVQVIDGEGRMTEDAGTYARLDRFDARKRIVKDLEELGLLEKVEAHKLAIGRCQRCQTIIEPLVSTQWFVKAKPLAEKALKAVEDGSLRFAPENWNATYFNWMNNIRDWCISRQLWWGHRIPAWHCTDCKHITVARSAPPSCPNCGSGALEQDPDVLDTWFSSGLWPFSTLGWPDQTKDLATYYPTSLMISGFDILFFWVARMIMMGIELTGEVPFREVHLHGLVRAADRQKMSKTKGNVIDPLEATAEYGTDALRISLIIGVASGTDIVYTQDKLTSARSFANKIWNASRLIFLNMEKSGVEPQVPEQGSLETLEDRWIFSELHRAAESVNRAFENHRYHEVAETLWHFFWNDLCDWYLEMKKLRLAENTGLTNDWRNLLYVFSSALKLMHPVMPFITEELWQRLGQTTSISLQPYPQAGAVDESAIADMDLIQRIIGEVRVMRANMNLASKPLEGRLYSDGREFKVIESQLPVIAKLTNVKFELQKRPVPAGFEMKLEAPELDTKAQRARLEKEIQQHEKLIADKDRQLSNERFMQGAPPHVIEGLKTKRAEYQAQLEKNRAELDTLQ
jgi:valyl-tRNA synthetase